MKRRFKVLAALALLLGGVSAAVPSVSSADAPPATTTTDVPGVRLEIHLSLADNGTAADSFKAATDICTTKVMPKVAATRLPELQFPACQVAVQVCARMALDNAAAAVVYLYDDYFDCSAG